MTESTDLIASEHSHHKPKRVILRLRVLNLESHDHNWNNHVDAITIYLKWAGRPIDEYECDFEKQKHYARAVLSQALDIPQKTIHVVIDMEQRAICAPDFNTLPHEIYRFRRNKEGKL